MLISKIKEGYNQIKPFKDIIWFLILFLSFDFIWKIFIHEGENEDIFLILGKDFTSSVQPLSQWTADISYWVIHDLFGYSNFRIENDVIFFNNPPHDNLRLHIVWGCTGMKQMIMFTFIICLYFGPVKKKLWFIPLSIVILIIINIIRIVATSLIIKDGFPSWFIPFNEWYNNKTWNNSETTYWDFYVDWFQLFHKDVFKWLYYDGVMFILWLFWQEKFNIPYQKLKAKSKKNKELE